MKDTAQAKKDKPQQVVDNTQTPQDVGGSPEGKEPSPKETPRTYTQEQVDKLTQLASVSAGRKWKSVETERDNLKTKITDYENKIMAIEAERESLQKQIDDLSKDDPDKFALIKRDKELREREKKLQDSLTTHETDKKSYAQQIADAKELDTLVNIYLISEQFEDGDADKLADLCEQFGAEAEEEIRSVAETLWSKKEGISSMETDSGETSGGAKLTEQDILKARYPSMFKK